MRSRWRASHDLSNAVDGYARAITALMSMPARLACDFSSAFENAACRSKSSGCCDPCPPKCETSCDPCGDPCDRCGCAKDDCCCESKCDPCQTSSCGCGDLCCSKCRPKAPHFPIGVWVEVTGGLIGQVREVKDYYVTIRLGDKDVRYAKTGIRRVLPIPFPLKAKDRVQMIFGVIGRIDADVADDAKTVKVAFDEAVGGKALVLEFPRAAISEIVARADA